MSIKCCILLKPNSDWIFHYHIDEFWHCGRCRSITYVMLPQSELVFWVSSSRKNWKFDLSFVYRIPRISVHYDFGISVVTKACHHANAMKLIISISRCLISSFLTRIISAEYIKQCEANDPQLVECIKGALHHLRPWLRTGIPEIQVSWTVELCSKAMMIHWEFQFSGILSRFQHHAMRSAYCLYTHNKQ